MPTSLAKFTPLKNGMHLASDIDTIRYKTNFTKWNSLYTQKEAYLARHVHTFENGVHLASELGT